MKIKHRATVDQKFTDEIVALAGERAEEVAKTLTIRSESALYDRNIWRGMEQTTIRWVRDLAAGGWPNKALDQELARLYTSKYECFGVQEYNNITYLWGKTLDVTMTSTGRGRSIHTGIKYDIGPYFVYVPKDAFLAQTYGRIHWVPARKVMTPHRHPHHTANIINDGTHPLSMSPYTCSGGFGRIFAVNLANMEIAGLFRSCYIFLTRYNTSSPLASPDDFMKRIEGEQ